MKTDREKKIEGGRKKGVEKERETATHEREGKKERCRERQRETTKHERWDGKKESTKEETRE